jgi:hypothetical protein
MARGQQSRQLILMAFRFRRSKSFLGGLLRITAGKRGLSLSVGVPGARASVNTSGRQTTTVGIPGTGLSWSRSQSQGAQSSSEATATMTVPDDESGPATERQVAYIESLGAETGLSVTPEEDGQPVPLSALTKAQASKVIDTLLAAREG